MSKKIFFAVFLMALGITAFSQEKKVAAGVGLEFNMDSRHNFAGGASVHFDYALPKNSALGLFISANTNFFGINVIESAIFYRAYFPENDHSGFFVQPYAGVFVIFEDGEITPLPLLGVGGGYRFLLGSSFYLEPVGRLGYPYAFGIGLVAGMRF